MGNPRYANGHRRRELRKRVLARDSTCWLCGLPVDKRLHHLDPMAPEVHEILPVSRGGDPLAMNNTALTHRRCNQWIGNRTAAEISRQRSTAPTIPVRSSFDW